MSDRSSGTTTGEALGAQPVAAPDRTAAQVWDVRPLTLLAAACLVRAVASAHRPEGPGVTVQGPTIEPPGPRALGRPGGSR